jgi:hypothetical protein
MIMSAAKYHKRKAIGSSVHKNAISQDIYTLLQAYEAAGTPNKKLKILVLLYFMCLSYEKGKFGAKGPSYTQKKFNLVLELKKQIEDEVESADFKQKYANKLGGESYKGGVKRADAGGGTQLKGAYGIESIAPRKGDQASYGLSTKVPAFGLSLLSATIEDELITNKGMSPDAAAKAAHQMLSSMSMTDVFKELHKFWGDTQKLGQQFNFVDTASRANYLATYSNNVWSCSGMTPYTTGTDFNGTAQKMYVMDRSHQLYIPEGVKGIGSGSFNHSSMLSGKPVLCAGTLKIDGTGKLTYIDNDSGHYKPDTQALKDAVRSLRSDFGMMINGLAVMDKATGKTLGGLKFLIS